MADYAPPPGPPPPKVPEGFKAIWNDQYKEWFYVNIYSKQSQWDKPTEPVYPPTSDDTPPPGLPPGYDHSQSKPVGAEKSPALGSNNPFNGAASSGSNVMSEDEQLARKLQEEEDARAGQSGATKGAADSYYQGSSQNLYGQPYGQQQGASPPSMTQDQDRGKKSGGGFLGKLKEKLGGAGSSPRPGNPYPAQGCGGGYQQQQGYGGYPQQGYGGYPQQGYGGYPQQGYGYGQPQKKHGGGMGMAGGAALGVGAGLIGGALIADAINDDEQEAYQEGYEDGGGGDDFGGDF